jgi:hypothetical protein
MLESQDTFRDIEEVYADLLSLVRNGHPYDQDILRQIEAAP